MIAYYIVKFFSWLMCVSPKFVRNGVAHFLGSVAVMATPEWRLKMAAANVQECLGVDEARARQIAEDSLHRFGRMIVEVMRFPLLKPDNIDKLVTVDGLEYLEKAYKEGKGVIMATGHFGNWELLGATVALHGYPMLSITRKQNNSQMDRFINEYREMVGQKVAYNRGKSGLLAISRMLKEKHLLGRRLCRVYTARRYCRFLCTIIRTGLCAPRFIRRFTRRVPKIRKKIFTMLPKN